MALLAIGEAGARDLVATFKDGSRVKYPLSATERVRMAFVDGGLMLNYDFFALDALQELRVFKVAPEEAQPGRETYLGDVNGDKKVDLTDAIMIVYSSLGQDTEGFNEAEADVNNDGNIDLTDAITVVYESLEPAVQTEAPETLWVPTENRFNLPQSVALADVDSLLFMSSALRLYKGSTVTATKTYSSFLGYATSADASAAMVLGKPERAIWKPTTSDNNYNNDYYAANSQWTFANSKESEHFIVFWDKRFGSNPNASSVASNLRVDVNDLLKKAENFYTTNVNKLTMAFLGEGKSQLDTYKMSIYLLYDDGWTAVGSGYDDVVGALWVTPSTCHPVGSTIAHEIGHSFQYQVAADYRKQGVSNYLQRGWRYGYGSNGAGGNAFWEQCAQWQAHQDYPSEVFSYHIDVWLANYHRHFTHEWMRYASYWWQYQIVEKHGYEAYGQLWRGSRYPEDPLETYKRMFCDNDWDIFWDDYFDYATKLQNYQFEDIHKYLSNMFSARQYKTKMYQNDDEYWQVAYASCPETSGVNFIPLTGYKSGGEVSVSFVGLDPGSPLHASDPGHAFTADGGSTYDEVTTYNTKGKATDKGWHYAFVAIVNDGTVTNGRTVVSEVAKTDEGTISFTIPAKTIRLSLCVVGTPKTYNRHEWNEKDIDDVQWPYKVKFDGCRPSGL